jgi:two-component system, chemotaxis family, CheB/CheR fusion protein
MPRSAIATGMIDVVIETERMADLLVRYRRHLEFARARETGAPSEAAAATFNRILTFLQTRAANDFRLYKKSTLMRRMHRRLGLHGLERLAEYEKLLRRDPDEVKALVKDLMINVTGFFRDPEAWQALNEEVIVPLVRDREAGDVIRVWVPACASGEEAYTIAILIAEQAEALQKSFDVKIFATDSAEDSLNIARRGLFPASIEGDVSDERLRRFFERSDDNCQIRKELRDWVIFAPQNLLYDPPFFRVDLVSCRNFLIYLEEAAQSKVIARFHFALSEGGHLFLGTAESLSRSDELFEIVSKKWRIYRRVGPTRLDLIDFPIAGRRGHSSAARIQSAAEQLFTSRTAEIAQRALANRFAPASVMIDRGHRIVYFHGATDEYLVHPPGQPTRDLFAMAREGLRTKLRAAVQSAARDDHPVTITAQINPGHAGRRVMVTVSPILSRQSEGMLLVTFEEQRAEATSASTGSPAAGTLSQATQADEAAMEREFETELKSIRDELSHTIEELETSNEELKASNEEITSINEELQSANEELDVEGRAAVAERGAEHRQQPAAAQGRRARGNHQRSFQSVDQHGDCDRVPRPPVPDTLCHPGDAKAHGHHSGRRGPSDRQFRNEV